MEDFYLELKDGKLYATCVVDGAEYEKDVTSYFENSNPHDEWLDFRLNLLPHRP